MKLVLNIIKFIKYERLSKLNFELIISCCAIFYFWASICL